MNTRTRLDRLEELARRPDHPGNEAKRFPTDLAACTAMFDEFARQQMASMTPEGRELLVHSFHDFTRSIKR